MEHVLEGGQAWAHDAGTPNGVWIAHWSRVVHHGVQAKRRNQGDLLAGRVSPQFQDAVGWVAEHLHGRCWLPAPQQTDYLASPLTEGFMANPQTSADLWSRGQDTQQGSGPPLRGPRHPYDYCQHDPTQSRAAH
jgi:hypothetical protein